MAEFEAIGKALQIPQSVLNNIEKIDQKINLIASDSEKMATHFMSAMTRMGGDAGNLLQKLQSIQNIIGGIGSFNSNGLNSISSSMSKTAVEAEKAANGVTKVAVALNKMEYSSYDDYSRKSYIEKYKMYERMFDEIERNEKRAIQAAEREAKAVEQAKNREYKVQAQLDSKLRKQNYQSYVTSTEGSLRTADKANTYTQRAQAIKNLEAAIKKLRTTDANYEKDLAKLSKAHKNLSEEQKKVEANFRTIRSSQHNLMNTSDQLARKLALIFSVSQITGYVKNLARVRGEFELQNTALASILQNKDKADILFGQITELAVQSPFTLKELTTYTKSLSAYSVEYEKLYDTTKMLADVSAGLGVDMQRLILAFGQVKAANFLRGCLGYNTPVMLYDGSIKKVQDVVVGDVLINEKGEPVNVLELIRGRETMFLVEQVSGNNRISYRVNRNHILTLWNVQEQRLEDVYVYDYLKNKDAYLGLKIVDEEKVYYDIEVTKDRIDDYYGFVLDGNKRFRLGDGTITHNTETRQFTEAGINMLGELAKYYTELEGRIVSVGEVQERQFKRMISFQDVEEVFKRLTSAGGMFYNMQEKQSETLAGMISNLQDSIDIMLNDIGKANDGALKGTISFVKTIIENWEKIAQISEPIVSTLVLYISLTKGWASATKFLPKIWESISKTMGIAAASITRAEAAQKKFNFATRANAWLTILSVAAVAIWEIVNAIKAANKEQEELNKISSEGYFNSLKSSSEYKRLANIVSDTTASYKEQEEALKQLKREYGEILPKHYLEAEAIRAMKGNYDEATAAIKNYMLAKTQEKQLQLINENEGVAVKDAQEDLAKIINKQVERLYGYKMSLSEVNSVLSEFRNNFDKGNIKSIQDARNELNKLLSIRLGLDINIPSVGIGMLGIDVKDTDYVKSFFNSIVELKEKTDEIISSSSYSFADKITIDLQKRRDDLEKQISESKELLNVISKQGQVGKNGSIITQEHVEDAKNRLSEIVKQWGIDSSYISKLTGDAFEIKEATTKINKAAIKSFSDEISKMNVSENQKASLQMFIQGLSSEISKFDPSNFQSFVETIIKDSSKINNISLGNMIDAFAGADETISDYSKRIGEKISQLEKDISLFEKNPVLVPEWGGDRSKYEEALKMLQVYKDVQDKITVEKKDSTSSKSENEELNRLKEKINLLKKVGDEYENLRKKYREDVASEIIRETYKNQFSDYGLSIDMDFDTEGIISSINSLIYNTIDGGKKAVDEVLSELNLKHDIEFRDKGLDEIREKVENIFSGYEFNLELNTKGISPDTFKNMLRNLGASEEEISAVGLDVNSIEDVQKRIRSIINELNEQGGTERLEAARKYQEQLTQLEIKEAQKRFDELTRLREKYQANEQKITKVQTDIDSWKNELEKYENAREKRDSLSLSIETGNISDSEINRIKEEIKSIDEFLNEEQEELLRLRVQEGEETILKLKSEALQLTDFWKQLFGDLEDLSVNSLRTLSDTVDDIIGSSKEIKGNKGQTVGYSATYKDKNGVEKQVTLTVEQYQRLLKQNNKVEDEIQKKNPFIALFDAVVKGKNKGESGLDYITRLDGMLGDVSEAAFNVANDLADIFGADEEAKEFINNIKGVVDGAVNLGTGIARIASGDIIGGAVSAVSGIAGIVTSIRKIHDNRLEKDIERQADLVDNLEKSYDKLYKTIENGLSIDTYSQNSALIQNLMKQVDSYRAMISAERAKKDTDNDRIKEWENSIDNIYSQINDLYENLKTNLIGDFRSVSEQLGDAIADAFANGTDAAAAWGESVNDIIGNIVKRLLIQKLIEPGVQDILNQMFEEAMPKTAKAQQLKTELDELRAVYNDPNIDSRYKRSLGERIERYEKLVAEANKEAEGEIPNITEDIVNSSLGSLEKLGEEITNNPSWNMISELAGGKVDTMTGLQKGIRSITEETADILASITESIRYFTSDSNSVLHNIYNFISNMPMESPLMQELKIQSEYLSSINSLLNSVSKNVQSNGKAIKVQIV